MRYCNPVIKGFHPDPSICFDGQWFYLVTSTFEFFPGVPLFRSKNLVNWELIGHCLHTDVQCVLEGAACSGGIYAPTIRYHQGTYFMVTTNVSHGGHLIVHTRDPLGPWSPPVYVDQGGIDPSLLFDGDQVYFTSTLWADGRQAIAMCQVDPFTGEKTAPTRIISHGMGGKYPEAPHVYKINGKYYLMLAEGGTEYGHMVTLQQSDSPYGPYTAGGPNPILSHRDAQTGKIQCTGHADLVEDAQGNWWMVCLGIRPLGPMLHNLGRETFLAPVQWRDGWPVVGQQGRIALEMDAPLPGAPCAPQTCFEDRFDQDRLALPWTFVRNPVAANYVPVPQGICLKGDGNGLDSLQPTFMGVRQTEFATHTQVRMDLPKEGSAAGLAAFYNAYYYYALRIVRREGCLYAEMEKHLHDTRIIEKRIPLEAEEGLTLHLYTDRDSYRFAVEMAQGTVEVGQGHPAGLCTEGTMMMTFTGVFIGLFAVEGDAVFRNFVYREVPAQG